MGLLSAHMARIPGVRVLAIEPLPDIADQIPRRPNLKVLQAGIRDVSEPSSEVLIRSAQSELSSFVELNPNVDTDLWSYHLPLAQAEDRVAVKTMSLETVFREYRIQRVDFLKIDAQGIDLEVLRSCRSYLPDVAAICLEVPFSFESSLYADEPDAATVIAEVQRLGFAPVRLVPNGAGEANLFAANLRLPIDNYFQLEDRLDFRKAPTLKIGPHRAPLSARLRTRALRLASPLKGIM